MASFIQVLLLLEVRVSSMASEAVRSILKKVCSESRRSLQATSTLTKHAHIVQNVSFINCRYVPNSEKSLLFSCLHKTKSLGRNPLPNLGLNLESDIPNYVQI